MAPASRRTDDARRRAGAPGARRALGSPRAAPDRASWPCPASLIGAARRHDRGRRWPPPAVWRSTSRSFAGVALGGAARARGRRLRAAARPRAAAAQRAHAGGAVLGRRVPARPRVLHAGVLDLYAGRQVAVPHGWAGLHRLPGAARASAFAIGYWWLHENFAPRWWFHLRDRNPVANHFIRVPARVRRHAEREQRAQAAAASGEAGEAAMTRGEPGGEHGSTRIPGQAALRAARYPGAVGPARHDGRRGGRRRGRDRLPLRRQGAGADRRARQARRDQGREEP